MKPKRYQLKRVESYYGFDMDAGEMHEYSKKMALIHAQIKAEEPENLALLQELGRMILDLQIPDDIIQR